MANLCELSEVIAFLQREISDPDEVVSATRAIEEASGAIREYCHQYIEYVEDEEIKLDGSGRERLFLPQQPVVDVSSVVEDGETLADGDDYELGANGVLYRVGGVWAAGRRNVVIIYSHGYDDLPDTVVAVCARAASRGFQAGLKSQSNAGVPGVASKQLGDYAVAFTAEGGEGVMGASAARILLKSEMDALDRCCRYVRQR